MRLGDRPELTGDPAVVFDTIVDSALFHVFGTEPDARAEYVRSLHATCKPGGLLDVLALSDREPGFGPRISDSLIRESFGDGSELEDLQPTHYRGRITEVVADQVGQLAGTKEGIVDLAAWLARIRRVQVAGHRTESRITARCLSRAVLPTAGRRRARSAR